VSHFAGFLYRDEWDLGDIVTIRNAVWGVEQSARIVQVEERITPNAGAHSLTISLDRPWPTVKERVMDSSPTSTVDYGSGGGSGSGGHTIQEDGSDLTDRAKLNFGSGLTATDDAGNDRTNIVLADHAGDHASGGGDAVTPAAIGAATSGHDHDADYAAAMHNTQHNRGGSDLVTASRFHTVANYAALVALGSPAAGDVAMTTDTGRIWKYTGTIWTPIDQYADIFVGMEQTVVAPYNQVAGTGIGAAGAGDVFYIPFAVGRRRTVTTVRIAEITSGGATGTCCVGIYGPHASNALYPGTRLGRSGDVSVPTTGADRDIAMTVFASGSNVVLDPGNKYWLAITLSSTTPQLRRYADSFVSGMTFAQPGSYAVLPDPGHTSASFPSNRWVALGCY
jgi:hypothetical protein